MGKNNTIEEVQNLEQLKDIILLEIEEFKLENNTVHPYDIAEQFIDLRDLDSDEYYKLLKKLPHNLFAEVLAELPEYIQEEISQQLSSKKLADITSKMDTDDAADFIQALNEDNEEIAQDILENIEQEDQDLINQLIAYDEDEAGAYMQTELFSAKNSEKIGDAISRLKLLKESGEIDNIWHCHVTDDTGKYIGSVGLEELIIFEHTLHFNDIPSDKYKNYYVGHKIDIKQVIEMVTNYNLT